MIKGVFGKGLRSCGFRMDGQQKGPEKRQESQPSGRTGKVLETRTGPLSQMDPRDPGEGPAGSGPRA